MTARHITAQKRAEELARKHAADLLELERQEQQLQADLKIKRRELKEAEQQARSEAETVLGKVVADLAGAATAVELTTLAEVIRTSDIAALLASWRTVAAGSNDADNDLRGHADEDANSADFAGVEGEVAQSVVYGQDHRIAV